jgi:hypothetical protein
VHVTFVGIIPENTVDNNTNFSIIKPAFGTEPCLGGYGGRRHEEDGGDAN